MSSEQNAGISLREYGELEATVRHLADSLDKQTAAMDKLSNRIQTIENTLLEAKGGWKVMMWIAGGSSAVGAIATWFVKDILGK